MADIDEEKLRQLIEAAVQRSVAPATEVALHKVLEQLGIDATTVEARKEVSKDQEFLRKNRERCEKIIGYAMLLAVGGVAAGVGTILLQGVGVWVKGLK